jgi:hypothetical protein
MSKDNAFMGLDPDQARKVAKHLKGSADEIRDLMRGILKEFGGVQWTGKDMQMFDVDLKKMANSVGGDTLAMDQHSRTVDDRVRMQEEASRADKTA